ncbi:MAG: dihydrofolate reductase [Muribaculum sp.]|nr:dihydrofolate reductase [Muribaculum sp.]
MTISIIAAVTADMGLGLDGQLLYHISDDLRRFKALTLGHPVIMGRKTFESFPNGPLPGRLNIVLTRDSDYRVPQGAVVATSVDEALALAGDTDPMIIGGGQIYAQFMPVASKIYLTAIDSDAAADTWFPAIDPAVWQLTEESPAATDPKSGVTYRYLTYQRI